MKKEHCPEGYVLLPRDLKYEPWFSIPGALGLFSFCLIRAKSSDDEPMRSGLEIGELIADDHEIPPLWRPALRMFKREGILSVSRRRGKFLISVRDFKDFLPDVGAN